MKAYFQLLECNNLLIHELNNNMSTYSIAKFLIVQLSDINVKLLITLNVI